MANKQQEQKSGVVYRSLVTSLFEEAQVLLLSNLSSTAAILLTAYKNNSLYLYGLAGLTFIIGLLRVHWTQEFQKIVKQKELTNACARAWEKKYAIGAVTQISIFGWWFFSVSFLNDPVSELISMVVVLANLIGVCCRSYPFSQLVTLQLAFVSVPLVASFLMLGGYYHALGALLVPYIIGMRKIAIDLRRRLLGNIFQRRAAEKLAGQFDTTLNNVPQGICMYDSSGVLEVANQHIIKVIGRSADSLIGCTAIQMIDLLMHERGVSAKDCAVLLKWATNPKSRSISHVFEMGEHSKRWIKFRSSMLNTGGFIATYEDVTKEILATSRIDHMTRFDRLTGLLNRDQFTALLEQEIFTSRKDQDHAVLLINLDNFKHTNEVLGHRFGDLLLCAASDRIKNLCGENAVCARYEGDEFAILIGSENCVDHSTLLADSISEELTKPFELEGRSEKMGCSIGITFSHARSNDAERVLEQARIALTTAKNIGGNEWQIFSEDMSREIRTKRKLEIDLRQSINNGELEAHFQPLVSIKQRKVSVCEALVRWKHPKLGYIPPFKFVPLAEEAGIIGEIGAWMLRESCAACATWPETTGVAVNLSPLQFRDGDIVKLIQDTLLETNLDPSRLEIEITESLMLDDLNSTISKLEQLKQFGVRISLDDFGTGYSSLSYMNKLPLDKVKIDRSFVTGLQPNSKSLTLVQAISGLGHQLGLSVVVEGIETSEELAVLLENTQVDQIQGYYFSRPVNKETIANLLDKRHEENKKMIDRLKPVNAIAA